MTNHGPGQPHESGPPSGPSFDKSNAPGGPPGYGAPGGQPGYGGPGGQPGYGGPGGQPGYGGPGGQPGYGGPGGQPGYGGPGGQPGYGAPGGQLGIGGPAGYGPGGPGGYGPGGGVDTRPPPFPLWPIIVVTFFFSLFGLIPTILASNRAGERRESSSRYWLTFVFSMIGAFVFYVVVSLVLVFVVFASTAAVVGGAVAGISEYTPPSRQPSATGSVTTGSSGATTGPCGYVPIDPATGSGVIDVPLPPDPDPTPTAPTTWVLDTSVGRVEIALDAASAPCTVQSMTHLSGLGFFTGSPCPRSVNSGIFVLQCGDPTGSGTGGPSYRYADENLANATYPAGTIAMANSGPDTNGSQFFIVTQDSELGPDYTVFGRVTQGLEVIQQNVAAGNDGSSPGGGGAPLTPVTIATAVVQ